MSTPKFPNPPLPPEPIERGLLDLDLLEKEKQKLIRLIEPAIDEFYNSIGQYPGISIITEEIYTHCGTISGEQKIQINISL